MAAEAPTALTRGSYAPSTKITLADPNTWPGLRRRNSSPNGFEAMTPIADGISLMRRDILYTARGSLETRFDPEFVVPNPIDLSPTKIAVGFGLYKASGTPNHHALMMIAAPWVKEADFRRDIDMITERLIENRRVGRGVWTASGIAAGGILGHGISFAAGIPVDALVVSGGGGLGGFVAGLVGDRIVSRVSDETTRRQLPDAHNYYGDDTAFQELVLLRDHIDSAATFNEVVEELRDRDSLTGTDLNNVWRVYSTHPAMGGLKHNRRLERLGEESQRSAVKTMVDIIKIVVGKERSLQQADITAQQQIDDVIANRLTASH